MQPKVRSAAALPTLARPVPTTKLIQKTHKMSQGHEQHQALLAFAPAGAASQQPSLQRLVQQLAQSRISDCERIYLHIPGYEQPEPELVQELGVLYNALAFLNPRLLMVPLVACAGWDAGTVAALPDLRAAVEQAAEGPARSMHQPNSLLHKVQELRHSQQGQRLPVHQLAASSEPLVLGLPVEPPLIMQAPAAGSAAGSDGQQAVRAPMDPHSRLQFKRVALGGTFDRLHCGHQLLLATAALITTERAYVGITADQLLVNKQYKELLQPYSVRDAAAKGFMHAVNPGLDVQSGALSDPREPTEAELAPDMEAIVVSQETLKGAHAINAGRAARGFSPLTIVVVPVIGAKDAEHKLSSTELRAEDAAAAAAGASVAP